MSPILYLTTATPPSNPYKGAMISYNGAAGHKGATIGYYGAMAGPHHHGHRGVAPGHRDGGGPAVSAPYRYGQRPLPPRVRRGRDEQSYALYESPNTYEYMTDPRKKNERSRPVPGTERRPPGIEDVEIIDLRRPSSAGGHRHGGGPPRGDDKDREGDESDRRRKKKKKKKRKRKTSVATDTEVMGSSVHKNGGARLIDREKAARKNKNDGRAVADGHGPRLPGKHRVHEKNEYSKKRQFFDEEHVADRDVAAYKAGKKRPPGASRQSGADRKGPERHLEKRKRSSKKNRDDHFAAESQSYGYGQIVAVR